MSNSTLPVHHADTPTHINYNFPSLREDLGKRLKLLITEGLCNQASHDIDFFAEDKIQVKRAKSVCQGCPVRKACLEYAVDANECFGVWGGTDVRQRNKLVRSRAA